MELAVERAGINGIGIVSVIRNTHSGIAAYFPLMTVTRDKIGITMTNTLPAVVPTFRTETRLDTNPPSVAAPTGKHPPCELDMTTTVVSGGEVYISHLLSNPLPKDWVVDKGRRPITDPIQATKTGLYLLLGAGPRE